MLVRTVIRCYPFGMAIAPTDTPDTNRTERLNVRLTAEEREILRRASKRRGDSISDFVRTSSLEAARKIRQSKP